MHAAGRRFAGEVAAILWSLQASDAGPDLRSVAICSGHFEVTWAREGRLHQATQYVMDHTTAEASKIGVSLAKRAAGDDFFWRDVGSAPARDPLDEASVRWQGTMLAAIWAAGGFGSTLRLRRAELSRAYRETAFVVEWSDHGRRFRLVLDVPPAKGTQQAAEDLADDLMLALFEGHWDAIDVGPA